MEMKYWPSILPFLSSCSRQFIIRNTNLFSPSCPLNSSQRKTLQIKQENKGKYYLLNVFVFSRRTTRRNLDVTPPPYILAYLSLKNELCKLTHEKRMCLGMKHFLSCRTLILLAFWQQATNPAGYSDGKFFQLNFCILCRRLCLAKSMPEKILGTYLIGVFGIVFQLDLTGRIIQLSGMPRPEKSQKYFGGFGATRLLKLMVV